MTEKFNIQRVEQPAVLTGFELTLSPDQLMYVTAVLGATVRSGSIPDYAKGVYQHMRQALVGAGLAHEDSRAFNMDAVVDEDGVPYAGRLFDHLGLEKV
jgi:hypothetical protein